MKTIIGGLAAGVATYYLIKWIRGKPYYGSAPSGGVLLTAEDFRRSSGVSGIGADTAVYDTLFSLRDKLKAATDDYVAAARRIEDLDLKIAAQNDEYRDAEADRKATIMFRIAEIQRQRDLAVMEAELVIRNIINPLREALITEEARLKSVVEAPSIALHRTGQIPAF